MRLRFTRGFRGVVTGEVFYEAGAVADFDDATARLLIEVYGAAVPEPEPARKPRREKKWQD